MSEAEERPNPWKKQLQQDDDVKPSPFKKFAGPPSTVGNGEEEAANPWKKPFQPKSPTEMRKAPAVVIPSSPGSPMQQFSSGPKGVPTPRSPLSPSPQQLRDTIGNAFLSSKSGKSPGNSPAISRHPSALSVRKMSEPRSPGLPPTLPEADALDSTVRSRVSNNSVVPNSLGASHSQIQQIIELPVRDDSPVSITAPDSILSPEARIAELEAQVAAKDRELKLSRDQVEALQRLQANSNTDAKIRVLNEERSKLATRIKETETRLNREITKLKSDNTTKTQQIGDLKTQLSSRNSGARKSLHSAEAAQAAILVQVNELKYKVTDLQKQLTERVTENQSLSNQLAKAQEAIVCGASSGYDSEVKLHQARSALHAIMNEVASAAASSPRAGSASPKYVQQSSPTNQQQQQQYLQQRTGSSQSCGQMQSPTLVGIHYLDQHQQQASPQRYSSSQQASNINRYSSSPSLAAGVQ